MKNMVIQRKIAPSSVGNTEIKVPSTALWRLWALTCPTGHHPFRKFLEKDLKEMSTMEETIHSYDTFTLESAEI